MTVQQPTQQEINDFVDASAFEVIGVAEEFLDTYPSAIDGRNANGDTALVFAAWLGRPDVVALLLQRGADVNAICGDGLTALISAAKTGRRDIAFILIDNGADVTHRDRDGKTARDFFAEKHEDFLPAFDAYIEGLRGKQAAARIDRFRQKKPAYSPFAGKKGPRP